MTRRLARPLAACLLLALTAVACGDSDDTTDTSSGGEPQANLSGSIFVSGSSTVEPITALVAQDFQAENTGVAIKVDGPGTGDGFKLFCNGETDASNASRAIKEEEAAACAAKGIEFIELKVAIDGLSVITAQANNVECLSFADLYALVGPESQGFGKWSDANTLGKAVGGSGDYPDVNLVVTAPGEESGTYDSFVEIVLAPTAAKRPDPADPAKMISAAARKDYTASPNDNVIIEGIAGNPTSLGWVGFAFLEENLETVKPISIEKEEGKGCIEPTNETIADGTYPIARPLYVYVNKNKLATSPALGAFIDYYLSEDGIAAVDEAKYVSLKSDVLDETRATWEAKTVGKATG